MVSDVTYCLSLKARKSVDFHRIGKIRVSKIVSKIFETRVPSHDPVHFIDFCQYLIKCRIFFGIPCRLEF